MLRLRRGLRSRFMIRSGKFVDFKLDGNKGWEFEGIPYILVDII